LLGSLLMGLGASVMALSNQNYIYTNIAKIGRYTLGIYAIHIIVIMVTGAFLKILNMQVPEFIYPLIILLLSWVVVFIMSHNSLLRKVVM